MVMHHGVDNDDCRDDHDEILHDDDYGDDGTNR